MNIKDFVWTKDKGITSVDQLVQFSVDFLLAVAKQYKQDHTTTIESFNNYMLLTDLPVLIRKEEALIVPIVSTSHDRGSIRMARRRENNQEQTEMVVPNFVSNDILSRVFDIVRIRDEYYSKNDDRIARAIDTNNWDLIKNLYYVGHNSYVANISGYTYFEPMDIWVREKDLIITEDTKEKYPQQYCYHYHVKNTIRYYRYSELAPDYDRQRIAHYDYRNKIKESSARRIGVEFEFTQASELCYNLLEQGFGKDWASVHDGSITGNNGCEFISNPIEMKDIHKVSSFMDLAEESGAYPHQSCGFHVHISSSDFNFMDVTSLITLAKSIENELFEVYPNRKNNKFCKKMDSRFDGFLEAKTPKERNKAGSIFYGSLSNFLERHQQRKYTLGQHGEGPRYYWLNIDRMYYLRHKPEQKTVEFRIHPATHNKEAFLSFIYLCYYIVEYAKHNSSSVCQTTKLTDIIRTVPLNIRPFLTKTFIK